MQITFYLITAFAAILAEMLFSFPFVLLSILLLSIFQKKEWVFFVAIVMGLVVDSLLFRPFGTTGIFFLFFVGLIFLYQRKFETQHIAFVIICAAVSSGIYESVFYGFSLGTFLVILLAASLAGALFFVAEFAFNKRKSASN